jgi:hypothetical protein
MLVDTKRAQVCWRKDRQGGLLLVTKVHVAINTLVRQKKF